MTNGELKREILQALSDLVEHTPDIRFGQLIANLSVIARGPTPEAVWDMEDDELLEAVKSHISDDTPRSLNKPPKRTPPRHHSRDALNSLRESHRLKAWSNYNAAPFAPTLL